MKKYEICMVQGIAYEQSDTIEMQGKRDAVEKYLKNGYYVKEERNGYWVLVRSSRVIVMVKSSAGIQKMNMKEVIIDYYDKKRISEKQIEKFAQDIKNKKIDLCLNKEGNYFIKKVS